MSLIWTFVAVVAGLAIVNLTLLQPATARTIAEIGFDAPIGTVWEVYRDFESQPNWRSDVAGVDMVSDKRNWIEELRAQSMTVRFRMLE